MTHWDPKDVCEVVFAEESPTFHDRIKQTDASILMVAEPFGRLDSPVLKSDAGDFAKWIKATHPDTKVEIPDVERGVLRANDIWFPLVYLASNIALPVYIDLVANYLYDRMRGALKNDRVRVHMSAEFHDSKTDKVKRFNYEGDAGTFKETVKNINVDEFFNS